MPLKFHPRPGTVLICDFETGSRPPEMVKKRPVAVISPRLRRSGGLCTVVPLSTATPDPVERFHHRMDPQSLPGNLARTVNWAKCDLIAAVSLERLDRVRVGRSRDGTRIYVANPVTAEDLAAIRRCVMFALGLSE